MKKRFKFFLLLSLGLMVFSCGIRNEIHSSESSSEISSSDPILEKNDCQISIVDEEGIVTKYIGTDEEVTIPSTIEVDGMVYDVTTIDEYAFKGCSSLTNITIPRSITKIKKYAFHGCNSLTGILIPRYVIKMGYGAFYNCHSLTIYCESDYQPSGWDSNWNTLNRPVIWGVYSLKEGIEQNYIQYSIINGEACVIKYLRNDTEVVIPSKIEVEGVVYDVKGIADGALKNCTSITSITLPFSYKSLGYLFGGTSSSNQNKYVPKSLKEVRVTGGTYVSGFSDCDYITTVIIGNEVTSISSDAFNNCDSLSSVTIGNGVTKIGGGAFKGCYALNSITLPFVGEKSDASGATYFGHLFGADSYDNNDSFVPKKLKEVVITSGVKISPYAFYGCSYITNVIINEGVTKIWEHSFSGCSSLTNIDIPNSVTTFGTGAFENCSSLTKIKIPSSVTVIGDYAFDYCYYLTIYCEAESKPSGWRTYWNSSHASVYWGVTSLKEGILQNDIQYSMVNGEAVVIKHVGTDTKVVVPSSIEVDGITCSVIGIAKGAFQNSSSLTSIELPFIGEKKDGSGALNFGYIFGAKSYEYNKNYVPTSLKEVIITGGEKINCYAFYECDSLTSIVIPDSVTTIGENSFYNCSSLINMDIPNSVTLIETNAFFGCSSLTNITIPNSVKSINSYVFRYCTSLNIVFIPSSVTAISYRAFFECGDIVVYCEAASKPGGWNSSWYSSSGEVFWNITSFIGEIEQNDIQYLIINGTAVVAGYVGNVKEVVIPSTIEVQNIVYNVTEIRPYAFQNCTNLISLELPDSVTVIRKAFYNCDALVKVILGNKLTKIDEYTFYNCDSLTNITIPHSVITIESKAFQSCNSLTTVTFGDGLTTIKEYAFQGCSSLTSIVIPNSTTTIESFAFQGCSSLKDVIIPNNVTNIGKGVFQDCSSLYTISLPFIFGYMGYIFGSPNTDNNADYVPHSLYRVTITGGTSIGRAGFLGCEFLNEVIIPRCITSIGDYAFRYCYFLTIYCEATSKPSGWSSAWNDHNNPVVWGWQE